MCHYSKSTKGHAELVASTCRTAVNGVATAFIAADEPDRRLDSDGKTSFLLLRQFKGYKNNDPGEQSQQCLPFSLLKKMLERPVAHLAIFIVFHQLMLLGFFFAMRSCENFKYSGERRTHPRRQRNIVFRKGGQILPHSSPPAPLSRHHCNHFRVSKARQTQQHSDPPFPPWSVVTSSHDGVLRRRLLLPQTQQDARDHIPNQLIASQSFLGVPGWGWGANVLSYSPNLAHCAVQTSSMQPRGFTTRWSEARRLTPRGHVTPKLHRSEGAEWIRTFCC